MAGNKLGYTRKLAEYQQMVDDGLMSLWEFKLKHYLLSAEFAGA